MNMDIFLWIAIAGLFGIAIILFISLKKSKARDVEDIVYPPFESFVRAPSTESRNYNDIFTRYYNAGIGFLANLPVYSGDDRELYLFLYNLGAYIIMNKGENYAVSLSRYLQGTNVFKHINNIDIPQPIFIARDKLYEEVSSGRSVRAEWSAEEIYPSVLSIPMFRSAVAFFDIITNPSCARDYSSAPSLQFDSSIKAKTSKMFNEWFLRYVKFFCIEIAGHDFVPPLINANREADTQ